MKGGSSVSGRRALSVFEFELNPLLGDPREQIRRATCDLPADTNVRVVCTMAPIPIGCPIETWMDYEWYRGDLNWQFIGTRTRPEWARGWEQIANHLGGIR